MKAKITATIAVAVVALMVFSVAGAATYSWFSDSEETDITVSTATIDITSGFVENPSVTPSGTGTMVLDENGVLKIENLVSNVEIEGTYKITSDSSIPTKMRAYILLTGVSDEDVDGAPIGVKVGGSLVNFDSGIGYIIGSSISGVDLAKDGTESRTISIETSDGLNMGMNFSMKIVVEAYQTNYVFTPVEYLSEGNATIPKEGAITIKGATGADDGVAAAETEIVLNEDVIKSITNNGQIENVSLSVSMKTPEQNDVAKINLNLGNAATTFFGVNNWVTVSVVIPGEYSDLQITYGGEMGDGYAHEILGHYVSSGSTTVTFRTNHFSDFMIDGSRNVVDATDFVNSVNAGKDVTLGADIILTGVNKLGVENLEGTIVINGNGKKLTIEGVENLALVSDMEFNDVGFIAKTTGNLFHLVGDIDASFIGCDFTHIGEANELNYIQAGIDEARVFSGNLTVDGCEFDNTNETTNRSIRVVGNDDTVVRVVGCVFNIPEDKHLDTATPLKVSWYSVNGPDVSGISGNAGAISGRTYDLALCDIITDGEEKYVSLCMYEARIGEKNYDFDTAMAVLSSMSDEDITVTLLTDVSYDVSAWNEPPIGNESTKTITFEGNGHKFTFNHLNSDWNNVVTNGAKLILRNMTITNSGHNDGPWNRHDINFACDVKMENVTSDKALAFKAGAELDNVTVDDANDSDTYAIWIQPNGQTVTLNNCTIDMLDCSDGRGIKIDQQYVDKPSKVILNVSNTKFSTEEKSAIIVNSTAGAEINLSNVDIEEVAADKENAVWVDDSSADYFDLVIVKGGTKIVEP